jgi:hypothetical protein
MVQTGPNRSQTWSISHEAKLPNYRWFKFHGASPIKPNFQWVKVPQVHIPMWQKFHRPNVPCAMAQIPMGANSQGAKFPKACSSQMWPILLCGKTPMGPNSQGAKNPWGQSPMWSKSQGAKFAWGQSPMGPKSHGAKDSLSQSPIVPKSMVSKLYG